jgi:antitoxin FitA
MRDGDSSSVGIVPVGQLTVRKLDDEIIRRLKLRAARHGRSAEAELRAILEEALQSEEEDFWTLADRLRAETPQPQSDSGELVREMRDER